MIANTLSSSSADWVNKCVFLKFFIFFLSDQFFSVPVDCLEWSVRAGAIFMFGWCFGKGYIPISIYMLVYSFYTQRDSLVPVG